jgi:hypothetical protein
MTVLPMPPRPRLRALDRILDLLEDVVAVRDPRGVPSYRCTCPVGHAVDTEDERVVVTEGDAGRVDLTCEAGCKTTQICKALGIEVRELFPRPEERAVPGSGDDRTLPPPVRALEAPPIEPVEWAIEDLWTKGEIGLLVGDGGSFKSTAAIHMAAAMAGGYPVFNRFLCERKPVMIVSAEDSLSVVMMRLEAFVAGHGWDRTKVFENVYIFALPDITLSETAWQAHLAAEAIRLEVGMIILDPLADLLAGDENSNTEVRPVVKWARVLGAATGAAVAIVHHAGKQSQDKRTLDRIRGASAIPSAARTIFFFEWQERGVLVQHLKMSRAPKLAPFVLSRRIESEPDNRTVWRRATLTFEEAPAPGAVRAATWILAQVRTSPRQYSTSDLKKNAQGSGISGEDISRAINVLLAEDRLGWEPGKKGAKRWFATAAVRPDETAPEASEPPAHPTPATLPDVGRQGRQGGKTVVADVAEGCPATTATPPATLPAPLGGRARSDGGRRLPGKVEPEHPPPHSDDDSPWWLERE